MRDIYGEHNDLRDEIVRLREENDRYRTALEEIAQWRVYELTRKLAADALGGEKPRLSGTPADVDNVDG